MYIDKIMYNSSEVFIETAKINLTNVLPKVSQQIMVFLSTEYHSTLKVCNVPKSSYVYIST